MKKITVTKIKQVKKANTKTVWVHDETTEEILNEQQYNNCVDDDTIKFFRSLGGSETVTRSYTKHGYNITQIVSTSPDKQDRTIRKFAFDSVNYDFITYDLRRKNGFTYDDIDVITNSLMKQAGNRETAILNNYDRLEVEGNLLSIISKGNNSFNIDLRKNTLGNLV